MRSTRLSRHTAAWLAASALYGFTCIAMAQEFRAADIVLTPDQQGQRQYQRGEYDEAANRFADPMWRATALYRAGDFEAAAAHFARAGTPEAAFNRGNALVFLGQYQQAIAAYDQALSMRPNWQEAADNRSIAEARAAALAPPDDDAGGTGGMLEADEIVIDDSGRVQNSGSEQTTEGGQQLTDQELRALWLRRVDTRPGDFLKVRFAQQLRRAESPGDSTDPGEEAQ